MTHFKRVIGYLRGQYKLVVLSMLCAMGTAALFSLSLAAMLPMMKVLIGEEGLDGWLYRAMIKDRSGIVFEAVPLGEYFGSEGQPTNQHAKLRISSIQHNKPASNKGLLRLDEITAVQIDSREQLEELSRGKFLKMLAEAPADTPIILTVQHETGGIDHVTVQFKNPLDYRLYHGAAQWFLSHLPEHQDKTFKRNSIILIILIMLLATFLRCAFRFAQDYLVKRVSFHCIMELRQDAYKNSIRLPMSFFSSQGVSDIISRFVQDTGRINTGITTSLGKVIREPFTILFLAVVAFYINSTMTLIVLGSAPLAALMLAKLGRKMKRATRRSLKSWSEMLNQLQQTMLGIRVVKGYHRESYEDDRYTHINKRLLNQQFRIAKIDAGSGPIMESIGMIAASVGMICAAFLMTEGMLAISEFTALILTLGALVESGRKMGNVWPRLNTANAAAERVFQLIDQPAETDPPQAKALPRMNRDLVIEQLRFFYPNNPQPVLDGISLSVKAGETVAIVGPNGSGKTTLISMIPRFFVPDEGCILIDGHDIADVTLCSLREQIGIVTQQSIVFNDTIAANIAYGKLDATQEEIIEAAKQAYAHEFIQQTSDGYETVVGENGVTLSGGQLQRLSIARAILSNPSILIFDEAMSQIDSESEAKIQKAILEFAKGRTSFIIAHRLSTIIHADRIVVLDRGHIAAMGSHEDLIRDCTLYRQLYDMQFINPGVNTPE